MKVLIRSPFFLAVIAGILFLPSCTEMNTEPFWIYTGLYEHTYSALDPIIQKLSPKRPIHWYSTGSEAIIQTLEAEFKAGIHRADLVLLTDPLYYFELKQNHRLLSYDSPAARDVPDDFKDSDHYFSAVRYVSVGIGYNRNVLGGKNQPKPPASWAELKDQKWKNQISMPNPVESGSGFTSSVLLSSAFGWDFFPRLFDNKMLALNMSSSVVTRIELAQKPVGILLLEDILEAKANGIPIEPVVPKEGLAVFPGLIAIMDGTSDVGLARRLYDWFYSDDAQNTLVKSGMNSALARIPAPVGGMTRDQLLAHKINLPISKLKELAAQRPEIRKKIDSIFKPTN